MRLQLGTGNEIGTGSRRSSSIGRPTRKKVVVVNADLRMPEIKRIAVFCGSSKGTGDIFMHSATLLGQEMVRRNLKLVYGGQPKPRQWSDG